MYKCITILVLTFLMASVLTGCGWIAWDVDRIIDDNASVSPASATLTPSPTITPVPTPIPTVVPMPTPPTPNPILFYDFNSLPTDVVPAGWTEQPYANCSSLVKEFPSAIDKSLLLSDNNGSGYACLEYTFSPQANNLIVEWKWFPTCIYNWGRVILSDLSPEQYGDSVTGINIYLGNKGSTYTTMIWRNASGTDTKFGDYAANTWYSMRLEINIPANIYTIYVDGVKAADATFRYPKASLSVINLTCGMRSATAVACYYDDIKITAY